MEPVELELTAEQASDALGLHVLTIQRYCRRGIFPRAHLMHGSRRYGYAIPEGDVLDYARRQSAALYRQAKEAIERLRDIQAIAI